MLGLFLDGELVELVDEPLDVAGYLRTIPAFRFGGPCCDRATVGYAVDLKTCPACASSAAELWSRRERLAERPATAG